MARTKRAEAARNKPHYREESPAVKAKRKKYPSRPLYKDELKSLTPKLLFAIDCYFANGFRKQEAMTEAGYSEHTARNKTGWYFSRKLVKEEIARRTTIQKARYNVTTQKVIEEYAKIAFASFGDYVVVDEDGYAHIDLSTADEDMLAAIGEYVVETQLRKEGDEIVRVRRAKFKLLDKKGALDSLARHLGLFNDKLKVEGELAIVDRLQEARKRTMKNITSESKPIEG